jgi:citrate synthase
MSGSRETGSSEHSVARRLPRPSRDRDGTVVIDRSADRGGPAVLDPGLRNTAICRTAISHIDGVRGLILYRGIPLNEIVSSGSYAHVACLLLRDAAPTATAIEEFEYAAGLGRAYGMQMMRIVSSLSSRSPLDALGSAMGACGLNEDETAVEQLVGLAPAIVHLYLASRGDHGRALGESNNHVWAVHNALCGITRPLSAPVEEQRRLLDAVLMAYAEHGMNCSTTAVRVLGSAGASASAAVATGIFCFGGSRHGGAADKVVDMLRSIRESGRHAEDWLMGELNANPDLKIFGFGHRVYRNEDPRTGIIRAALDRYRQFDDLYDPLDSIATELSAAIAAHPYFASRQIFPNVDLYVGACLRALGIPDDLYSTVITLGRTVGWLAHWIESRADRMPIIRPRDLYKDPPDSAL